MKRLTIATIMAAITIGMSAATPEAWRLFDSQGRQADFDAMVDSLATADVVFIGENHNCPISHWMELEITRALHRRHGDRLVLGEEMMEADNQLILDEYLGGLVSYDRFETEARLWPNYSTDYYPVVYYAKDNGIPFVATNVPRRYANAVSNGGLKALEAFSDEARRYMAPLPIPFEYDTVGSAEKFGAMMMLSRRSPEEMQRLAEAQALKDATMAWFIARNLPEGKHMVHINGTMHSDYGEGIIPYLKKYKPGVKVMTVTSRRQDSVDAPDPDDATLDPMPADYLIIVQNDFPTSY